jgi:hypothetical protein
MNQIKLFAPGQNHKKNIHKIKGGLIHALMMNHDAASP